MVKIIYRVSSESYRVHKIANRAEILGLQVISISWAPFEHCRFIGEGQWYIWMRAPKDFDATLLDKPEKKEDG